MSKAQKYSVKFTGANIGDELVGMINCNRNLRIRIHEQQKKQEEFGGRVKGSFTLLDAGDGEYHEYLKNYVGDDFDAKSLIDLLCRQINQDKNLDLDGLQIFNRNILKVISE